MSRSRATPLIIRSGEDQASERLRAEVSAGGGTEPTMRGSADAVAQAARGDADFAAELQEPVGRLEEHAAGGAMGAVGRRCRRQVTVRGASAT